MKTYATKACILFTFLLSSCEYPTPKTIGLEQIKESTYRAGSAHKAKRVHFYDANKNNISADQFNRLLANGSYVFQQRINKEGLEEIYLIDIKTHSKSLVGTPLPDFQITDIQGNTYTKKDLIGKVSIITFWMTASFVCVQELKMLHNLLKDHETSSFLWLAPALDPSADLSRFLRGRNLNYVFIANQESLAEQLGLLTYPTHLIIDKEGKIKQAVVRQPKSKEMIKTALQELL